jgi:hypothetical protein
LSGTMNVAIYCHDYASVLSSETGGYIIADIPRVSQSEIIKRNIIKSSQSACFCFETSVKSYCPELECYVQGNTAIRTTLERV